MNRRLAIAATLLATAMLSGCSQAAPATQVKPPQSPAERDSAQAAFHMRQFRAPSLRNVAERAPYMHAGQFATLRDVVDHYNRAPAAPQGHSELKPVKLSDREAEQLVAFLATLSGPVNADAKWLEAPKK